MYRRRVLLGALLGVLFALGWWAGRGGAAGDLYANLDVFVEVMHAVQTSYVDPVEPGKLVQGGINGMLSELDPYSQYMDERASATFNAALAGGFDGIGAYLDSHDGYPVVIAPLEGSPAWEAGLLPGDVVLRIDGSATAGLTIPDISGRLRGAPGTTVRLSIARAGESEARDVEITRRRIETHAVPYSFIASPGVGYVRLARFSDRAGAEVRAAMDTLRAAGAHSLVLDLRGNPGGLVDEAVSVVEQFVPEGSQVVYTKGRNPAAGQRYVAARGRPELGWPVALLIDNGSASASEIVAGALQDLDRAVVVGSTSFGKGSVQSVYPLRNHGGALKLTTSLYFTPSGRSIHRRKPVPQLDEEGDATTDTVAASGAAPAFRTKSGRIVYGGGGITPDVAVTPDSLPPLARVAEDRRLAFRFAGRWTTTHGARASADAAAYAAFIAELRALGLGTSDTDLAASRSALQAQLTREFARRAGGAAAAARVSLAGDRVFHRALERVSRARLPRDVFAGMTARAPEKH